LHDLLPETLIDGTFVMLQNELLVGFRVQKSIQPATITAVTNSGNVREAKFGNRQCNNLEAFHCRRHHCGNCEEAIVQQSGGVPGKSTPSTVPPPQHHLRWACKRGSTASAASRQGGGGMPVPRIDRSEMMAVQREQQRGMQHASETAAVQVIGSERKAEVSSKRIRNGIHPPLG
jgi:hypothetical protein